MSGVTWSFLIPNMEFFKKIYTECVDKSSMLVYDINKVRFWRCYAGK